MIGDTGVFSEFMSVVGRARGSSFYPSTYGDEQRDGKQQSRKRDL